MYHIIINPKSSSGKGIKHWWNVKNELDRRNIAYKAYLTEYSNHASEIARDICQKEDGVKNLIVLGGDGTLNEMLNGIEDFQNVHLGYIPSGSSNDLARSLQIPKNPLEALERILSPKRFQELDFGEITFQDDVHGPRRYICSSGFGWDANVCVEVQASPLKKKLNKFGLGKLIYIAIAIKQIIQIKLMKVSIVVDEHRKEEYEDVLLISNMIHRYEGGGLPMAPKANATDGMLDICVVHGLSRWQIFFLLPTIFFGFHIKLKGVEYFSCKNIEIKADHKAAVHTDGETPAFSNNIHVSCKHKKVKMIL